MSLTILLVTTANRTRRFVQPDAARAREVLEQVRQPSHLFTNRALIVASASETELFAPSSLCRVELHTSLDVPPLAQPPGELSLRALAAGEQTPPARRDDKSFQVRVDFFFEGGDTLATWVEGAQPAQANERVLRLTRLFELPVLPYHLPQGGIGFLNPAVMTRALIAGADAVPASAWRAEPA